MESQLNKEVGEGMRRVGDDGKMVVSRLQVQMRLKNCWSPKNTRSELGKLGVGAQSGILATEITRGLQWLVR